MLAERAMYKYLKIIVIIATSVLISFCSKPDSRIVATVDGVPLRANDLIFEMTIESGKYDPVSLGDQTNFAQFRKQVLDKLIQEKILLNEADRIGITIKPGEVKKVIEIQSTGIDRKDLESYLKNKGIDLKSWQSSVKNRIKIERLLRQEIVDKIPVSEKSIKRYYDKNIQEFRQPTQFRARQILVDTNELGEQILGEIKKGTDFGKLAKKYSLSPDGKRGGDLGYFDAEAYPEAFSETCQNLKIGETSDVIATDYGYQIFQLVDRRPSRQLPLDEVKNSIKEILAEEEAAGSFKEWFENITENNSIIVDEKVLSGVKLNENS